MTDEELETLIQETSEQIAKLSDPEKPLNKEEKKRKLILRLQNDALERIKKAKEKGNQHEEIRAGMDYALFTNYGDKNPLLINYIKSQTRWYGL